MDKLFCQMRGQYLVDGSGLEGIEINLEKLIFEERVKMNCYYCGKYNSSWRCPPKIPDLNFKKVFKEYRNGAFIYLKMPLKENNYAEIRVQSSVQLHKTLLNMEKFLWDHNKPLAISFIGGSCKLCKNGCGKEKCNNPYMARTPLEATGVNVVESAAEYGIDIVFPPNEHIMRLGLILW